MKSNFHTETSTMCKSRQQQRIQVMLLCDLQGAMNVVCLEKGYLNMNEKYCLKKLDENDILEILLEHFQESELSNFERAKGCLRGTPGEDLRFVGVFSNSEDVINKIDFEKIDDTMDYNGDHAFLKLHPEFNIDPT